jgi:hypothetical protein
MSINKEQDREEAYSVEWFGTDGALCLAFVVEAFFIGYCMINNVDIVIGTIVPYGVTIVTFLIFLRYIGQVISFSKGIKKNDR